MNTNTTVNNVGSASGSIKPRLADWLAEWQEVRTVPLDQASRLGLEPRPAMVLVQVPDRTLLGKILDRHQTVQAANHRHLSGEVKVSFRRDVDGATVATWICRGVQGDTWTEPVAPDKVAALCGHCGVIRQHELPDRVVRLPLPGWVRYSESADLTGGLEFFPLFAWEARQELEELLAECGGRMSSTS